MPPPQMGSMPMQPNQMGAVPLILILDLSIPFSVAPTRNFAIEKE